MKRNTTILLSVLAITLILAYYSLQPPALSDSLLFVNGTIITMEEPMRTEAVLVEQDRIIAVGPIDELKKKISERTQAVDLRGSVLLPGFIEAHTHPMATALLGMAIDVSGFSHKSRAEVMATLKEKVSDNPINDWNIAFGWDPIMIADLEPPTLAELDALSPDKPLVILTQMMHDAYANSAALAAANIDNNTPDPIGGKFLRDADGNLTGALHEVNAIKVLFESIPEPPTGAIDLLLNLQYGHFAKAGYTTLGILGAVGRASDPLGIIESLALNPRVPVRTVVYALPEQLEQRPQALRENEFFKVQGVKFWMDGSPFTGGAAWQHPYEESWLTQERLGLEPGHTGKMNYSEESFAQRFIEYHRQGYAIAVHVQGEQAVDRVLQAAEQALTKYPRTDHRHRLEHNALISEAQIQKAAELGIALSFFIDHIYFYGDQLPLLVGEERVERYMPMATAMNQPLPVTFHGDHPATPIDPFRSMTTAISRKARDSGDALGITQAITIEQALRAITINGAWQLGVEEEVGSIKPGKKADFVVLNKNPLEVSIDELASIEVRDTWINGKPVNTDAFSTTHLKLGINVLKNLF